MHRIIIQISEAAQRAAILAGGNAAREQTFTIGTGAEDGGARARLLALPPSWTSIGEKGAATVVVPTRAKVSPEHFAGQPFEDWRGSHYLAETVDLRCSSPPANAAEALDHAESVAGLGWLAIARELHAKEEAERAERDAAATACAEVEREARAERERQAREAEREREAREAAEEAEKRAQIGALFGAPDHPERVRYDAGAMSDEEIGNAVETRLTAWLPEPDLETGAFAPLSIDAHRYQVSTLRPGEGRTAGKLATRQEAFAFFAKLQAAAKAWVARAPERRSVEMWRAVCDCGQPVADVLVRDGYLEWDGWVALGESPEGHPEVAEDDD